MNDVISRQAAIDTLNELHDEPSAWLDLAVDALENLPSAQPEIIRCKDCKKWHTNCLPSCGKHGCDVISDYTKPDDFCSWAERRPDERTD